MSCFITVCFDVHDFFAPEMIFLHHLLQFYYFHKIKSSASIRQHCKLKEKRKDKLDRMKRIVMDVKTSKNIKYKNKWNQTKNILIL